MKVRLTTFSALLFTIALVALIPPALNDAHLGHPRPDLDGAWQVTWQLYGELGMSWLVIIAIGLIVTWTAYVRRARWSWAVMCVIAWLWAFPLLVLPLLKGTWVISLREVLYEAMHQPGSPRDLVLSLLIFVLMIVALILPLRSFVRAESEPATLSRTAAGVSASVLLLAAIGLFAWAHLAVYQLPDEALRNWQQVPPPPPPPDTK